jgi:hypothetical protein
METARKKVESRLTEEQLEAAYVMWKAGGHINELAEAFNEDRASLAWFFVMHNKLANFDVHYGVTNK